MYVRFCLENPGSSSSSSSTHGGSGNHSSAVNCNRTDNASGGRSSSRSNSDNDSSSSLYSDLVSSFHHTSVSIPNSLTVSSPDTDTIRSSANEATSSSGSSTTSSTDSSPISRRGERYSAAEKGNKEGRYVFSSIERPTLCITEAAPAVRPEATETTADQKEETGSCVAREKLLSHEKVLSGKQARDDYLAAAAAAAAKWKTEAAATAVTNTTTATGTKETAASAEKGKGHEEMKRTCAGPVFDNVIPALHQGVVGMRVGGTVNGDQALQILAAESTRRARLPRCSANTNCTLRERGTEYCRAEELQSSRRGSAECLSRTSTVGCCADRKHRASRAIQRWTPGCRHRRNRRSAGEARDREDRRGLEMIRVLLERRSRARDDNRVHACPKGSRGTTVVSRDRSGLTCADRCGEPEPCLKAT
ncbi:unnamed protein product [Rangifer tarandus platyrhynchus]|uniref:Uncharacterized protein n=1 Tax=Rangifer tarandus platyrhynchus TaxID=3082113 RepID=A0ABN8XIS3_RANTA|nr:unnamed protein product [Rangifer tarandus platyrhynchus]